MALLKAWTGSAWAYKPLKVWTGAAWVIKPLKRWTGTAWQIVSGIISVTLSSGYVLTSGSGVSLNSVPVTATPTGGSGSFSYLWTQAGGDLRVSPNSENSATTTFNCTGIAFHESVGSTFICTVTDTITGQSVASAEAAIDFFRT